MQREERKLTGDGWGHRDVNGLSVYANCYLLKDRKVAWKASIVRYPEFTPRDYWFEDDVFSPVGGMHFFVPGTNGESWMFVGEEAASLSKEDERDLRAAVQQIAEGRERWIAAGRPPL